MATYKEIKGVTVQTKDEDPVQNVGTWSSGGSVNTGRAYGGSSGTSRDAAMYFGGYTTPTNYANTEQYNGTSWTEVNDLSNSRTGLAGFGNSLTSAVAFGGDEFPAPSPRYLADVEEWDGTNWTSGTNLPAATQQQNGAGTLTAGLAIGGDQPSSPNLTQTLEYDGTNWTSGGNLNTGKQFARVSCGIQTAALIAGAPGYSTTTEQYNGTAWTEVNDLNTAGAQGGGGGTYTSAVTSGNQNTASSNTETWDGTSWTETNNRSTDNYAVGGSGSSLQNGIIHHGYDSSPAGFPTATEEWAFPPVTQDKLKEGMIFLSGGTTLKGFGKAAGIPAATFASGGSLNTARGYHGGAGTDHEALLAFGGTTGTAVNNVEQYNGSSWSEVAEINTTRANVTGFGSSTAAIAGNGSTPDKSQVESWNGSAWTEIAELNTSRSDSASAGIQTSGMVATGTPVPGNPALQPGGTSTVTETWNGTSWTEVGDTNTKRLQAGMAVSGTTSAGIIAAGEDGPGSRTVNAETWNGTSWTEVSNISQQRGTIYNFMGHSTSANMAGGYSGTARVANNEHWNGSSWTEINDLSTARNAAFGAGSAVNGAVFGGDTGDYQSATEEFIADNALSTVTVS